ncbi:MAG: response regulator [Elusimicrobiales bacterium]
MGKKVFIVEDSPELLEVIEAALRQEGFEVAGQETGRNAVVKIKETMPDVILLDVILPCMDGHAIASQLSQDDTTKKIPIVVITALVQSKSLFDKFGQVKSFVTKPFSASELVSVIKTAV